MEGISRIDLFTIEGKLYVNEFENVDSQYTKAIGDHQNNTYQFLVAYYIKSLEEIITTLNI